jgi:hypothetical protein
MPLVLIQTKASTPTLELMTLTSRSQSLEGSSRRS